MDITITQSTGEKYSAFFQQSTDIPTWHIGDYWTYQADIYSDTQNGIFDITSTDLTITVSDVVNISTHNTTWDSYHVTIQGPITGSFSISILSGDVDGTINGDAYLRRADLSLISSNFSMQGIITVIILQYDFIMNNNASYFQPMEYFDFPIEPSEQWNLSSNITGSSFIYVEDFIDNTTESNGALEGIVRCLGIENITVPMGTFETYHLLSSANGSIEIWYGPVVHNIVKAHINQTTENETTNIFLNLSNYQLTNPDLIINQSITPSPSVLGEYMNISGYAMTSSGQPLTNATVSIQQPLIHSTWSTTTNGTGYYHINETVPLLIDATPTTYDIGSDGIITTISNTSLQDYTITTLSVIANTIPLGSLTPHWNFFSPPLNHTIDTNDIIIKYQNNTLNWTQATSSDNPSGSPLLDSTIFGWNRIGQYYTVESSVQAGYGYWLFVYEPCDLYRKYVLHSSDEWITVIENNWNMIGSGCSQLINKTDLFFTYNGSNYNWSEATSTQNPIGQQLIDQVFFGWNHSQFYETPPALEVGKSYWLYCYISCTMKKNL